MGLALTPEAPSTVGFPVCTTMPVGGVRAACAAIAACKVSCYILALQYKVDGLVHLIALPLHEWLRNHTSEPSP